MRGLSGAPVSTAGVSNDGVTAVYYDAQNKIVLADGSFYSGVFVRASDGKLFAVTNGTLGAGGQGIGATVGSQGTNANMPPKKCCNCSDTDTNEIWFLADTRRTPKDIPVRVVRRRITCNNPDQQVRLDCAGIQGRAGLQGLGSLNCGFDNRM